VNQDVDLRREPKAIVHGTGGSTKDAVAGTVYVLNGEEAKVASGGGMRGIRALRKTSHVSMD
jgi:hypothetical protein